MADVLDSLKWVCSTDECRPALWEPFGAEVFGGRWACGTDGHVLAAFRYDAELRPPPAPVDVAGLVRDEPPTHRTTFTALRSWAGEVQKDACQKCEGSGQVEHDCDCAHCSLLDDDCPACDGEGTVTPPRYSRLFGGALNLNLLSRALVSAPLDGEVRLCQQADPLNHGAFVFRADTWFALVKPMKPGCEEAETAAPCTLALEEIPTTQTGVAP